jgi:hypothetical protein
MDCIDCMWPLQGTQTFHLCRGRQPKISCVAVRPWGRILCKVTYFHVVVEQSCAPAIHLLFTYCTVMHACARPIVHWLFAR